MSELDHDETESTDRRSTALWGGALVLAALATVVVVLSDDARLLRLGLVAALWSVLIGGFVVARLRARVDEGERAAADRQRIYELELEREIAARQEFEVRAEAEARRQARDESAAEMRSLHEELAKLRSTLEQVVGGDVLFERVALRAESTRVRSLSERGGEVVQHAANQRAGKPAQQVTAPEAEKAPVAQASVQQPPAAQVQTQQVPMPQAAQQRPAGRPVTSRPKPPPPVEPDVRAASSPEPKTEVISRISGQLDDRPRRPRPKQQFGQAFPDRSTPSRPDRSTRRAEQAKPEPAEPDDSGAHAAGTSVDDLIAAYGANGGADRRRRRRS